MARTIADYKKEIAQRREEILRIFQANYPGNETRRIETAMDYAELLHRGQLRRNGIPYVTHPLEVTRLVAEAQLDESCIIAALLHDTIEDTVASKQAIIKKFNPYIAEIVQALTKIRSYSNERSAEEDKRLTYQRILKASSKDIRPLLIKIFDRLANMRDMEHMPESHRRRVSSETLDVYVPITRRLGMTVVDHELSNLSLRYLYPEEHGRLEKKIQAEQREREGEIAEVVSTVQRALTEYDVKAEIHVDWPMTVDFFEPEYGLNPNRDIEVNVEITIDEIIKIYMALGILHTMYTAVPMAVRDMIASPMANGQRSLETRAVVRGRILRFNMMTHEMRDVNNQGIIHNWRVNHTRLSGYYTSYMRLLEELMEDEEIRVDEVLNQSHVDGIAVFSPRKDLYILPKNSTVLDFAYEVHRQIGDSAAGGLVNGIERGIDHPLKTGDVVQINTSPAVVPDESWLSIAITSKAQTSIKAILRRQVEQRAIELGRDLFNAELARMEISSQSLLESDSFRRVLEGQNLDVNAFFQQIGFRRILPVEFLRDQGLVSPEKSGKLQKVERTGIRQKIMSSLLSRDENPKWRFRKGDVFIKYAACCNPIFGDKVAGVVSEGKGVTVHRPTCPTLKSMEPSRLVDVEWITEESLTSAVLNLHVGDQQGVLAEILTLVKKFGINMSEFNAYTVGHEAFMRIRVDVSTQRELLKVVNEIRKIDAVKTITREE
jgi:GTP pyrophosphokinase